MPRPAIRWVLSAFDRETDALVQRVELPALDLDGARSAFGLSENDAMYDSYPVTPQQLPFLRRYTDAAMDLDRYDWFLDAYAATDGTG